MPLYAILLGADTYPAHPSFTNEAFGRSHSDFRHYLRLAQPTDACILDLFNSDAGPRDTILRIKHFIDHDVPAQSDVIVYFVGHGCFPEGKFSFALKHYDQAFADLTSMPARHLGKALEAAKNRYYLLLDCCFAAGAVEHLQGAEADAQAGIVRDFKVSEASSAPRPPHGMALLAASSRHDVAIAPRKLGYTVFTHNLLTTLRSGSEPQFSLRSVRKRMTELVKTLPAEWRVEPEVHSPRQAAGDVADIPILPAAIGEASFAGDFEPTRYDIEAEGSVTILAPALPLTDHHAFENADSNTTIRELPDAVAVGHQALGPGTDSGNGASSRPAERAAHSPKIAPSLIDSNTSSPHPSPALPAPARKHQRWAAALVAVPSVALLTFAIVVFVFKYLQNVQIDHHVASEEAVPELERTVSAPAQETISAAPAPGVVPPARGDSAVSPDPGEPALPASTASPVSDAIAATGSVVSAARVSFNLTVIPGGRVKIDGVNYGVTPIGAIKLGPGSHTIVVVNSDYETATRVVHLGAEPFNEMTITLTRIPEEPRRDRNGRFIKER